VDGFSLTVWVKGVEASCEIYDIVSNDSADGAPLWRIGVQHHGAWIWEIAHDDVRYEYQPTRLAITARFSARPFPSCRSAPSSLPGRLLILSGVAWPLSRSAQASASTWPRCGSMTSPPIGEGPLFRPPESVSMQEITDEEWDRRLSKARAILADLATAQPRRDHGVQWPVGMIMAVTGYGRSMREGIRIC